MDDATSITPSPQALRALTHPVRLRILGILRIEGPATATTLATRLGLNTGATSYHLRQLAQHGFVEEDAERGNARDRWWQARHQTTDTDPTSPTTPEEHDTYDAFLQAVAITYAGNLQAAVEQRRLMPEEWLRAGTISDWNFRLTPAHALALKERLFAVLDDVEEDGEDVEGAAPFTVNINAFRHPGSVEP
jgi:DNA-binding transcriptional ArsR family regulator